MCQFKLFKFCLFGGHGNDYPGEGKMLMMTASLTYPRREECRQFSYHTLHSLPHLHHTLLPLFLTAPCNNQADIIIISILSSIPPSLLVMVVVTVSE